MKKRAEPARPKKSTPATRVNEEPAKPGPRESSHAVDRVGEEIRQLRRSRGLSIAELAHRINRSVGFLSQIERGQSKPSLKDLYAISVSLGVQIGWFMLDQVPPPENERGIVVRANARRRYEGEGITTEALSPRLGDELEMLISTFQPGTALKNRVANHKGRETGFIMEGQLEMWIGKDHFLLDKGDSYTFLSSVPHSSRNPGDIPTVVLWVVMAA
ncbi:helix-turn-helix domain-containing protein [Caenimonas sp. SL110]|uniref:helix-turn-helix domain-containing protein n=1 Tax=Caenimonas sp. SL110 TaxID=1450524 RepID=UPI00069D33F8|nr:cupin domain-containing protein [Caenimonas sp. SL110]